jgi:hypothetical protein
MSYKIPEELVNPALAPADCHVKVPPPEPTLIQLVPLTEKAILDIVLPGIVFTIISQ